MTNKQLICRACNKKIEIKKDRYTHIEDWNRLKLQGDSWWHVNCFAKAMNRDLTELEKKAELMLNKASLVYNNLPEEMKQEVFKA